EAAAAEICGVEIDLQDLPTAGLTDGQIAATIIERCGDAADEATVLAFLEAMGRLLPDHLPRRQGRVHDGVADLLEDLDGDPHVISLLLTGNPRAGARAKLAHYGLDRWLADGAFCTGTASRADIARRAMALAADHLGEPPGAGRTFVIGDTPADIACAQAIGARAIGIASGAYGVDDLREAGAWRALDRLPEPPEFRRLTGIGSS
ncbi:MAG TPA: haloacid dehalogenase-like hydrolase, partial [Solirubrobacteraceae bacterium]